MALLALVAAALVLLPARAAAGITTASSPSSPVLAWTAPPFDPLGRVNTTVAYGMPVLQHTTAANIYTATAEFVYSHAAMLGFFDGFFVASWKNAKLQHKTGVCPACGHPSSEDTPGQRILWSYATADAPLNYSAAAILFPNVSTGDKVCRKWEKGADPRSTYLSPGCARLFAEPTVVIHGHVYAAASLRQFCLWPLDRVNDEGAYLLLRRITFYPGVLPKLGQIFWAKDPGDVWAATNTRLEIRTLPQMDPETQGDVASLLGGARPCQANATKCEYCAGGCQDLRAVGVEGVECAVEDVGGPWVERAHWIVPSDSSSGNNGGGSTDILVYRSSRSSFCFSQRHQGGNWSALNTTRLPETHSNMNAGTLPDGRVYLLHNPVSGPSERDPLVISLSSDGYSFDTAYVALSCHLPPVNRTGQATDGCKRHHPGGDGSPGPQYPQGLVHGDSLYVIMSMNKEDIWVEQIPLSSLASAPVPVPPAPPAVHPVAVGTREHLLLWGDQSLTAMTTLVPQTHPPRKTGIMAVVPDKPWERLIFSYNSVLKVGVADYRIYYDAFGSQKDVGNRFFCVATSTDGIVYTKPNLGQVSFENSTENNIIGAVGLGPGPELTAVPAGTVFLDENPHTPASEKFKMVNHNAYGSADGFHWRLLSANHLPFSDTLAAVFYDADSANYSIYCRKHDPGAFGPLGCPSGVDSERSIGLLQTKNLSAASWAAGDQVQRLADTVFKVDSKDPPCMDIYTSAAVKVADATFIFPMQYLHCNSGRIIPSAGGGWLNKGCVHGNTSGSSCAKLSCNSTADCNRTVLPNGTLATHPSCAGMALTCLPSKVCGAAGQGPGGLLCVEKLPDVQLPVSAPIPCVHSALERGTRQNDGLLDVGFAASRDGRHFERFKREPFLPRGPGRPRRGCASEPGRAGGDVCSGVWEGAFDSGSTNIAVGIMDRGTEETIMIGEGNQYTHGGYFNFTEPGGPVLSGLQILTMRRHGFVSLRPEGGAGATGVLRTRPLVLPKCKAGIENLILELNLHTALTGSATVELLPEVLGTGQKAVRSIVLVGNSAHLQVQFTPFEHDWEADVALPLSIQGTVVRLSFQLSGNADLYGFQFQCM